MFIGDIDGPRLRDIVTYPKNPSISVIKEKSKKRKPFFFSHTALEEVFEEIKKHDASKAAQETDIPAKTVIKMQIHLQFYTVKPLNIGHLRGLRKFIRYREVSAIGR